MFAAVATRPVTRDFSAVIAMILLVLPHYIGWVFLSRLNAGRSGFPLCLLYTRPVRTAVIVGLPMVYLTVVTAAIYLVSALVLRAASGYPFPLLPVAAWLAALNLVQTATNWSTRNMLGLMAGNMVAGIAWIHFAVYRLTSAPDGFDWHDSPKLWPTLFDFPLTDYVLIALIGLASFGITLARVARQRHGDARVAKPRAVRSAGLPWLENLLRSCPTSSATWAQIWFELRSSGLGVLMIGLVIACLTPLVFLVTAPFVPLRPFAISWTLIFLNLGLFVGTNSAFGIRLKRGTPERSEFDATLAVESAWLAGVKVIVRSICTLAVLIALSVSIWGSLSFIAVGKGYEPLRRWQRAIEGAVGTLTGYEQIALVVVLLIGFLALGAAHAALWALWVRYFRRMNIAASLLLLYGLALALLALAVRTGFASAFLLNVVFETTRWIAAAAIVLATVYLFWSGLAERLVTLRYVCSALLVSAVFAASWLAVLRAGGVQLAAMPTTNAVSMLLPVLLPLMGSVLAPWSLNRLRHT
jgi:hypothetical protein